MRAAGLIVAAGRGERAGRANPKQFEPVAGRPMLDWSLAAMRASPDIDRIVVVLDPTDAASRPYETAPGGATRTASVKSGLEALATGAAPDAVLIHDAARPGLEPAMVAALLSELETNPGVALALPLADAIKRADAAGFVTEDAPRAGLYRMQTPQAFRFADILAAYRAMPASAAFEDDVAVARAAGMRVKLVAGAQRLAKVTHPEDFAIMDAILARGGGVPLIGSGFDAHRFGPGDHITLCGVQIPHAAGLIGHSDADAGWHALTDAILGAVGAGDIGQHFPPSDPRWKGASSEIFLSRAVEIAAEAGARLVNADITILCEAPRIGPHREAMRARTADVLGLDIRRVSVKATTTEGMGFLGRREGLAAQASVLLLST